MTLILISKILGLSFTITKFAPINWMLELIQPIMQKYTITNLIYNLITLLLGCFSCCSLWIGFIMGGFWYGILCYYISYLYNQILAPKIDKIRLQ